MFTELEGIGKNLLRFLEWRGAIFVLMPAGVLLRVLVLALVGHTPLQNEAPGYMQMAGQLLRHEAFAPYWPPGVPYYLFLIERVFGASVLVSRASMIPVYAAFTVLLFLLVKTLSTVRAANLAALLFVFYPSYVRYAFNPSTEYPAAMCVIATVYSLILASRRESLAAACSAGLAMGALILVRPSSLLFAVFVPIVLLRRYKRVGFALIPLAVSALLVSAWLWKAYNMTGRFILINDSNAQNVFWGNNSYTPLYRTWGEGQSGLGLASPYRALLGRIAAAPPQVQNRLYLDLATHEVITRPDLFLLRTFNRARAYFGFPVHHAEPLKNEFGSIARKWAAAVLTFGDVTFYWLVVVMAILYLFNFQVGHLTSHDRTAILGTAAIYALPYWVSMSQPRYNFPVVPLLAVFAVVFADSLLQKSPSDVFLPIIASRRRKIAMFLTLAFFAYIQLEWACMTYFMSPNNRFWQ